MEQEAEVADDAEMGEIEDEAEVQEEEEAVFSESVKAEEEDPLGLSASQAAMLEAKIDPVEWKRELERVGPKLKVNQPGMGKDWRSHLEQTKKHEMGIAAVVPQTTSQLGVIGAEMTESMEKMRSKERFINNQHDSLREEYRQLSEELKEVEKKHLASSNSVGELTEKLAGLRDDLEDLQEKMDTKGNKVANS
ncbi:unnamed protein product, partial [Discosporangium mesarthrocarpum]